MWAQEELVSEEYAPVHAACLTWRSSSMSLIPATYSISNSEKWRSQEKKNLISKRTTIASTMRRRRRSLSFLLVGGSSNCFLILRLDLQQQVSSHHLFSWAQSHEGFVWNSFMHCWATERERERGCRKFKIKRNLWQFVYHHHCNFLQQRTYKMRHEDECNFLLQTKDIQMCTRMFGRAHTFDL